jgi:hypothetical protein
VNSKVQNCLTFDQAIDPTYIYTNSKLLKERLGAIPITWLRRTCWMTSPSSRDPKVGPKTKQWKKRIGAHFLTHSISGVGGRVRAPGWDYDKLTSENSR